MSEELENTMVQLDLNNLLAAIIKNLSIVAIPITDVLADYSDQSMQVSFDDESNMLILSLINNSDIEQEETESDES